MTRGQPLLHRSAEQPHPEVERGWQAVHLPSPCRPRQWHVFRLARQSDRLRRREDRPLVDRTGRQGHRDCRRIPGQATERSERRLGTTGRWALLHRPVLQAGWWTYDAMPQDGEHVYFLSADRRKLVRVTQDLEKPNGIIGTPDGKTLYVADIGAGRTYRYEIAPDGELTRQDAGRRARFGRHDAGQRGQSLPDRRRRHGVRQGGRQIEHIEVPDERWTAKSASAARTGKRSSSPQAPACTRSACA